MSTNSGFRWTVERIIALLAAGGGIVALLVFFGFNPVGGAKNGGSPTPSAPDCFLAGTVFDAKNKVLPDTAVGFEAPDGKFSFLDASDASGGYSTTCNHVVETKLKLRISRVEWGGCVIAPDNPKEVVRGHLNPLNIRAPSSTQCTKTIPTNQLSQVISSKTPVNVSVTNVTPRTLNPGITTTR